MPGICTSKETVIKDKTNLKHLPSIVLGGDRCMIRWICWILAVSIPDLVTVNNSFRLIQGSSVDR
jgi:hypothetical protein